VLRIFGLSAVISVAALSAAFIYGWLHNGSLAAGGTALALCLILGIMEVSLSFDNAVVNAVVLEKLNEYWQRIFLTVGVLVAAVGMRFLLPILVVWITAGLNPAQALHLAFNTPTDGSMTYAQHLDAAYFLIGAFAGVFLAFIYLDFALDDEREEHWLSWLERPLAKLGRYNKFEWIHCVIAFGLLGFVVTKWVPHDKQLIALTGGVLGALSNRLIGKLGDRFNPKGKAVVTGFLASFTTFCYLEVLDSSFSFDGVLGAFAITSDPIIIMLGLGFIGAPWVRDMTVYLVRKGTLAEYIYLEHGAMWAIGALATMMLLKIGLHIPNLITGLTGVGLIAAAFLTSVAHKRREVVYAAA
jgi:hypothetical protein